MVHEKSSGKLGGSLIKFRSDRWDTPKDGKRRDLRDTFKSIPDLNDNVIKVWVEKIQNIYNFTVMNTKSLAAAILFLYYNNNEVTIETFTDKNIEMVISVYNDDNMSKRKMAYYKADILRYLRNISEVEEFRA